MNKLIFLLITTLILSSCTAEKQQVFTIENKHIRIQINAKGAELKSLKNQENGQEYLWQANPEYWSWSAPILFPVIGKSFEDKYSHEGKEYPMPQHGFARDFAWNCVYQQKDSLAFELRASAETRQYYPFDFAMIQSYKIEKSRLKLYYQVKNQGNTKMPFVIGGHPGFNYPLGENESSNGYSIVFEEEELLYRHGSTGTTPDSTLVLSNQKKLHISNALFEKGAILLKHPRSSWIGLENSDGEIYLKMHMADFPYFGIWKRAAEGASFICLEPWQGLPGSSEKLEQITDKDGAIILDAGESFSCTYEIEI